VVRVEGFPILADATSVVWQLFGVGHRQTAGGSYSPTATRA